MKGKNKKYPYLLDTDIFLYDVIGSIGFVALVIFNFANIKKKREFLSSYIPWAVVEIFIISIVQFAFVTQINTSFGKFVGTDGNYFGHYFLNRLFLLLFVC